MSCFLYLLVFFRIFPVLSILVGEPSPKKGERKALLGDLVEKNQRKDTDGAKTKGKPKGKQWDTHGLGEVQGAQRRGLSKGTGETHQKIGATPKEHPGKNKGKPRGNNTGKKHMGEKNCQKTGKPQGQDGTTQHILAIRHILASDSESF